MTSRLSIKVDAGVGAFSVSPSGRDIALASQNGLFILDLQAPYTPPRWLPLHTIWEVADVQWCHHPSHPTWIVSTSNQKAILWNLALPSHRSIEHVLHGHNRAITDINFSTIRRDVLATCSVDTRVLVWDTRDTSKPAITFADFDAGATQVRWNKINPHVLASAHHRRIVVWDDRRNNIPLYSMEAHTGQVNGLDWEFKSANRILSCSTDREAKLWDLTMSTEEPISQITTTFPIWRAKYMPRGPGCLIAPLRGGDNNAYLIDVKDAGAKSDLPTVTKLTFSGHTEPIKEIGLRREGDGYDLITLSNDHNLSLWPIAREDLTLVEFPVEEMPPFPDRSISYHDEPDVPNGKFSLEDDSFKPILIRDDPRSGNGHVDWISRVQLMSGAEFDKDLAPDSHVNISKEVTRMSNKFSKLHFENIDLPNGACTLTLRGPWAFKEELTTLRVTFIFPGDYPSAPLDVLVEEHLSIEPERFADIEAHLKHATQVLADHSQGSFEYCLRYLMGDRVSLEFLFEKSEADSAVYPLSDSDTEPMSASQAESLPPHGDDENSEDGDDFLFADNTPQTAATVGEELNDDTDLKMDSTPLPKQCGAVWTASGTVLCFFNQNKDKPSYQRPLPLDRIFAGDDSDSDDIYESDSDGYAVEDPSSRNWSSTAVKLTLMGRFNGSVGETASDRRRDSFGTGSQTSLSISSASGPQNYVSTVDFSHLLPSSPALAEAYLLDMGRDPVELAKANAMIADEAGRHFDAYLWRFVLYLVSSDELFDPNVIFAGFSSFALYEPIWDWTGSPYGGRYIGAAIMGYLEQSQNLQLLASISLLFVEVCYGPYRGYPTMPVLREQPDEAKGSTGEKVLTLSMAADATAGAKIDLRTETTQPKVRPIPDRGPLTSQMRANQVDTHSLPVPGTTPFSAVVSSVSNVSDSPSPGRSMPTLPGRLSEPTVSYPPSLSSGPPTPMGSHPRSYSDVESTNMGFFDYHSTSRPRLQRNMSSGSGPRSEQGSAPGSRSTIPTLSTPRAPHVEVRVKMMNKSPYSNECIGNFDVAGEFQGLFTGWQDVFTKYRLLYARLLDAWGLHDKRLELLKHNYYCEAHNRDLKKASSDEFQAIVELVDCDELSNEHNGRQCRFCHRSITKQFVQCKNCNHIMHRVCADQWWGSGEGDECPSGCGCTCLSYI